MACRSGVGPGAGPSPEEVRRAGVAGGAPFFARAHGKRIEVRPTRGASAVQAGLSAVLVAVGVWIAEAAPDVPLALFELVPPPLWGVLAAGFFSLTGLHGLAALLRTDPVLIVDSEGIDDRRTWFSVGRVGWDEMVDVQSVRFRMVAVHLTDADAVLGRVSPWKRWLLRLDHRIFGTPVHLALGGLEGGRPALLDLLRERLEQATVRDLHQARLRRGAVPDAGPTGGPHVLPVGLLDDSVEARVPGRLPPHTREEHEHVEHVRPGAQHARLPSEGSVAPHVQTEQE